MAMMVYSSLHIFGRRGYELLIDESIKKARKFADMIEAHPDFELVTAPTLSILTYRVCPPVIQEKLKTADEGEKNQINHKIDALVVNVQKLQREAGKSFVSRTRLENPDFNSRPITVFRVVMANPLTTEQDLKNILAEQSKIAHARHLWKELEKSESSLTT